MLQTLLVMTGGAIGSALRYHAGRLGLSLIGPGWPWGTLFVNICGGFLMGLAAGWLALRGGGAENMRLFVAVGILGGFTTFSAFSLETVTMIGRGQMLSALAYVALSVMASVGTLAIGLGLSRMILGTAA